MARGMWRWWKEENGADRWYARIEIAPGEWADLSQSDYSTAAHLPAFWDLPLQEDYVDDVLNDPMLREERRLRDQVEIPLMFIGIGVFCVLFVVTVIGYMMIAWLQQRG